MRYNLAVFKHRSIGLLHRHDLRVMASQHCSCNLYVKLYHCSKFTRR
jgi:hypothetical protein